MKGLRTSGAVEGKLEPPAATAAWTLSGCFKRAEEEDKENIAAYGQEEQAEKNLKNHQGPGEDQPERVSARYQGKQDGSHLRKSAIGEIISVLCMKTATVVASCYFVFLSYVAVTYTHSWQEMCTLLPLFLLALIVPLLGKVMIREPSSSSAATPMCRYPAFFYCNALLLRGQALLRQRHQVFFYCKAFFEDYDTLMSTSTRPSSSSSTTIPS